MVDFVDLTYTQVYDRILRIDSQNVVRDRALAAFLFLTGCRISECVRFHKETLGYVKDEKTEELVLKKFRSKDYAGSVDRLKITWEDNNDFLMVTALRTCKRRKTLTRKIPIPNNDWEKPFIKLFLDYADTIPKVVRKDKQGNEVGIELFPFTRQHAANIIKKTGLHCHYFRHLRATKLFNNYKYREREAQQYFAWSDLKQAGRYIHLNVDELKERMRPFIHNKKESEQNV